MELEMLDPLRSTLGPSLPELWRRRLLRLPGRGDAPAEQENVMNCAPAVQRHDARLCQLG
jgi:hypothetical protein